MSRSLTHYLNDQCARVLRNLPYPIRQKVKTFAAIPIQDRESLVAVLCGPKQFLEGLWSLWSWMRYLSPSMGARLIFDGRATSEQSRLFQTLFPNGKLLELEKFLEGRPLPDYLRRFVAGNWTAKKFAAVYELQKEFGVLYSDSDVINFQKPDAIVNAMKTGCSVYLFDEFGYGLDPWLSARAEKLGIPVTNQFNAGLVYVPHGEMKESLLKAALADWQPSFNTHHAEQTLFSILLNSHHVRSLPKECYILSWQGARFFEKDLDCRFMVCRHYVGPVRHRMYLNAYPFLLNNIQPEDAG